MAIHSSVSKRKPPQRQCCDAVFTATSQGPLELADRPLRSEMVGRGAYMPGNYVVRADVRPVPGADLRTAERRKRRRYRELLATQRCHLLVAAVEVGGRWNEESFHFLVQLAKAKARQAPQVLRKSLELAWIRRWTGMLTHAAMDAFAASLLQEQPSTEAGADGPEPPTGELLTAER